MITYLKKVATSSHNSITTVKVKVVKVELKAVRIKCQKRVNFQTAKCLKIARSNCFE